MLWFRLRRAPARVCRSSRSLPASPAYNAQFRPFPYLPNVTVVHRCRDHANPTFSGAVPGNLPAIVSRNRLRSALSRTIVYPDCRAPSHGTLRHDIQFGRVSPFCPHSCPCHRSLPSQYITILAARSRRKTCWMSDKFKIGNVRLDATPTPPIFEADFAIPRHHPKRGFN
jgi:hypothetical protein